jgi:hypothetical protein
MSISETSSRSDSQSFSESSPSFSLGSMYDNNTEDEDSVNRGGRIAEQICAELERWRKDNIEYHKYRQQVDNNAQVRASPNDACSNINPSNFRSANTQLSANGGRPAYNTQLRPTPNNHPQFMSNTQFDIGTADLGNFSVFPSIIPSAEIAQAQATVLDKRKRDEIEPKPTDAIEPNIYLLFYLLITLFVFRSREILCTTPHTIGNYNFPMK